MTEPTEPTDPALVPEASRGLPRRGGILPIVPAVRVIAAGICSAIVAIAVNAAPS